MAVVHVVVIADRLVERFGVLFDQLLTDGDIAEKPTIRALKRNFGRGRGEDEIVIREGITIAPIEADSQGGVSMRDDYAYRFMVALGQGTFGDDLETNWPVATWEQAIRQRYHQSRIGVTGLNGCELACTVNPGKLPDWAKLGDHIDATILELAVWIREARRED